MKKLNNFTLASTLITLGAIFLAALATGCGGDDGSSFTCHRGTSDEVTIWCEEGKPCVCPDKSTSVPTTPTCPDVDCDCPSGDCPDCNCNNDTDVDVDNDTDVDTDPPTGTNPGGSNDQCPSPGSISGPMVCTMDQGGSLTSLAQAAYSSTAPLQCCWSLDLGGMTIESSSSLDLFIGEYSSPLNWWFDIYANTTQYPWAVKTTSGEDNDTYYGNFFPGEFHDQGPGAFIVRVPAGETFITLAQ